MVRKCNELGPDADVVFDVFGWIFVSAALVATWTLPTTTLADWAKRLVTRLDEEHGKTAKK